MRPDAATLAIEEAADLPTLERLRPDWEALWQTVPDATPFQSPAWLIPWWRHVGQGALDVGGHVVGRNLVGLGDGVGEHDAARQPQRPLRLQDAGDLGLRQQNGRRGSGLGHDGRP